VQKALDMERSLTPTRIASISLTALGPIL